MRQQAAAAVTAALVTTSLLAAPATSAEYAGPTITSPTDGKVVDTAQEDVKADSTAPFVRFRITEAGSGHGITAVVPVDTGVATYDWATAGFDAAGIVATDCTTAEETSCTGLESAPVTVDVEAPADTFTDPAGDVVVNPDDGPLSVTVAASEAPGTACVAWAADREGTRTEVVPGTAADLDLSGFTGDPATGQLEVWRCSEVVADVCTQTGTSDFDVTVRRDITMGELTVDQDLFSPDGNGLLDTVTASVALEDAPGLRASWSLLDAEGGVAVPAQDIVVTDPAATTFTVDPAAAGVTDLATGAYTLVVDASAPGGKNGFAAQQTVPLDVDVDGPVPTAVTTTLSTFYPVDDGYRDEVGVSLSVTDSGLGAGTATGGVIRVVNADGKVVRRFGRGDLPDGFTFAWDGRTAKGEIVPGRYTLEAVLTDDAGNRAKATSPAVTVSGKELTRLSVTRTVTARASLVRNDSGRCSKLRFPGVHGWKGSIGYLSQARCKGSATDASRIAAGVHGLRVPRAVRYHRVAISAYGGASKKGTGDRAGLHFFGNEGLLGDTAVLRPRVRWHGAGGRLGSKMVSPQRYVYWAVSTGYGQRYDVKSFRVTVTFTALR